VGDLHGIASRPQRDTYQFRYVGFVVYDQYAITVANRSPVDGRGRALVRPHRRLITLSLDTAP